LQSVWTLKNKFLFITLSSTLINYFSNDFKILTACVETLHSIVRCVHHFSVRMVSTSRAAVPELRLKLGPEPELIPFERQLRVPS